MKKSFFILLFLSAVLRVYAAPITINLASFAPERTPWDDALRQLAAEWSEATGGEVEIIIHPNGRVAGTDTEVLQKLRQGMVQAGILTSAGLNGLTNKIMTLSCPFLIRDDGELNEVLKNVKDEIESEMSSQYVVIVWSKIGWLKFFSRRPVSVPDDLRSQKLASFSDMPDLNKIFKSMKYDVVGVSFTELKSKLSNKSLDAVFNVPVYVKAMLLYQDAKYMCSKNVAPVMAGVLLSKHVWNRIPKKYHDKLMKIGSKIQQTYDGKISASEASDIKFMVGKGLVINNINAEQDALWDKEADDHINDFTGGSNPVMNRELYNRIKVILDAYRQKH